MTYPLRIQPIPQPLQERLAEFGSDNRCSGACPQNLTQLLAQVVHADDSSQLRLGRAGRDVHELGREQHSESDPYGEEVHRLPEVGSVAPSQSYKAMGDNAHNYGHQGEGFVFVGPTP